MLFIPNLALLVFASQNVIQRNQRTRKRSHRFNKRIDFITDPEELTKYIQKLFKILADLKKKNPSEHEKYEEMTSRLLEFNETHSSKLYIFYF